jgi:hypothetical protein
LRAPTVNDSAQYSLAGTATRDDSSDLGDRGGMDIIDKHRGCHATRGRGYLAQSKRGGGGGAMTSRPPLDCKGPITPLDSICSSMRAARL